MTPFCFDPDEREELKYQIEDLRDRYEELQFAADDLMNAIEEYNRQVDITTKFLEEKVGDCIEQLVENRTEKFQQTPRGLQIARWMDQMRYILSQDHKVLLDVTEYVDSDNVLLADLIEDVDKEA